MTQSRKTLVSLDATPYYHVTTRCVRRAFLCGYDRISGKNYSHRKQWFEERLDLLQTVFSVNVAAYAIMSNHYHVVVYIDEEATKKWTMDEVIERWCTIFKGPHYIQKYRRGETLTPAEVEAVERRTDELIRTIQLTPDHPALKALQDERETSKPFWKKVARLFNL